MKTIENNVKAEEYNKNILVVDDDTMVRNLIATILESKGYHCRTSSHAQEARAEFENENVDLLICDLHMPGESGREFTEYVMSNYDDTAVIMASGESDLSTAHSMLDLGVYDYIVKPIERNDLVISVENALRRRELEISNRKYQRNLENMVGERTLSLEKSMKKLETTMTGIVQAMASVVETRDPYTAGHQRRVADLAEAIARKGGLDHVQIQGMRMAALIHDLGKIRVPAEILTKPGRLSVNEFNIIKEHPQVGAEIIKDIEFPWPVAQIVRQHHERMNGSGYPLGLKNDEILVEARIIAIADVVEAMASHRPYRPGLGIDKALEEIASGAGDRYDVYFSSICEKVFQEGGFELT